MPSAGMQINCFVSFHSQDSPMETASSSSCSILQGLSHPVGPMNGSLCSNRHFFCHRTATPSRSLHVSPSSFSTLSTSVSYRPNGLISQPARLVTAFSSLSSEQQSTELAVLLEVEGYWPCFFVTFSFFKLTFSFADADASFHLFQGSYRCLPAGQSSSLQ